VGRDYHHVPVMTDRVAHWLGPIGGLIVDATFGGGGHSRVLIDANESTRILALDRDPDAGAQAAGLGPRVRFRLADFRELEDVLTEEECDAIDGALFDLGVSSHQLDVGERGFSYRTAGPLDMRMGPDAPITAGSIVNEWDERDIASVLRRFGEERHAGRIASAIVAARPIEDTLRLAGVVADAMPARSRRTGGHPARRTFQALRIAVNDELTALSDALDVAVRVLRPGGRVAVISYHSLEDRIVKRRFVAGARTCTCPPDLPVCACDTVAELRILTRGGETPAPAEIEKNPRARSARLRVAEKIT
jgi:16S rRNA (cytosine1402-N4)-methyltransferase